MRILIMESRPHQVERPIAVLRLNRSTRFDNILEGRVIYDFGPDDMQNLAGILVIQERAGTNGAAPALSGKDAKASAIVEKAIRVFLGKRWRAAIDSSVDLVTLIDGD